MATLEKAIVSLIQTENTRKADFQGLYYHAGFLLHNPTKNDNFEKFPVKIRNAITTR